MRRSFKENLIAVARYWWALVVGLGLGAYGLAQIVGDTTHHRSAWFWLFLAMAAIVLAQLLAYHSLRQERDRVLAQDQSAGSPDVTAADLLRDLQNFNRRAHQLRSHVERSKLHLFGAAATFWSRKIPQKVGELCADIRATVGSEAPTMKDELPSLHRERKLLYANQGFPTKQDIVVLLTAYIDALERMISQIQNQPTLEVEQ